ncbi:MAG: polysaccharide biosynthesis protein [Cetobacterium sp.]|uniref:polysaccharide biosynthesis protein n=1 Tax=Cetobacterium sp. TaxID=2071632 RepID=UPI003EE695D7
MVEEKLLSELLANRRNFIKIFLDTLTIVLGVNLALLARFENVWLSNIKKEYIFVYGGLFLFYYILKREGLKSWSYTNSKDVLDILFINILTSITTKLYFVSFDIEYSRGIILLIAIFSSMFQLAGRLFFRLNRSYIYYKIDESKKKVLVYGAGERGVSLVREQRGDKEFGYNVLGFIDDDIKKYGTYVNGAKVLGDSENLENICKTKNIDILIITMSNITKEKINEVVNRCEQIHVKVKILPKVKDMLQSSKLLNQVRDINIEDLLGRDEILVNESNIGNLIENKVVLVTGGAGSIGSELARQIAKHKPKKLITLDINENDLYFLELELKGKHKDLKLQSEICNIREKEKLEILFRKYKPNIVFHAAAHKHVPLMEHNPDEAIKNNIFGTRNLGELATKYHVQRFVLISTDKAVNPTNIMGATKRSCELIIESMNKKSDTKFMVVRFGNVLGSNGSVIPIFKKLIDEGKNLTITHPEITRYFMTIPEAAQLVIEAGSLGEGGELFVLDMGKPVKILDLARNMIKLSNANIDIDFVGLRPGEKLYEELLYDVRLATKTENDKIFIAKIDSIDMNIDLDYHLKKLEDAVKNPDVDQIKALMKDMVVTYKEENYEKSDQPLSA